MALFDVSGTEDLTTCRIIINRALILGEGLSKKIVTRGQQIQAIMNEILLKANDEELTLDVFTKHEEGSILAPSQAQLDAAHAILPAINLSRKRNRNTDRA